MTFRAKPLKFMCSIFQITFSLLEIYNEDVFDLLQSKKKLKVAHGKGK